MRVQRHGEMKMRICRFIWIDRTPGEGLLVVLICPSPDDVEHQQTWPSPPKTSKEEERDSDDTGETSTNRAIYTSSKYFSTTLKS